MGTFNVAFRIEGLQGGEAREFEGLVDTGSTYSVVPGSSLREMGIEPTDGDEFELADGRVIWQDIADARILIDGRSTPTKIVYGPEDIEPILGAYALEGLRLVVDPYGRQLFHSSRLRLR